MRLRDPIPWNHLDRMTDSTGLIQHAIYGIPRRESGYTTDDNARALRLCVRLWNHYPEEQMFKRATTYLSFLEYARGVGRGFHNFLGYDRRWLDAEGCGDCQGQAVRALAEVLGGNFPDGYRALARELIDAVLPTLVLTSPANDATFPAPATVIFAAGVTANGHSITGVEFYNHTDRLGEASSAPYILTWSSVPAGTYSLTARLVYDGGATLSSGAASVTVTNSPLPPVPPPRRFLFPCWICRPGAP